MSAGLRNGIIIGGCGLAIGVVAIILLMRCRRHHHYHHLGKSHSHTHSHGNRGWFTHYTMDTGEGYVVDGGTGIIKRKKKKKTDKDTDSYWGVECPKYTNCGPYIGVKEDPNYCKIRQGCEGITKKLY